MGALKFPGVSEGEIARLTGEAEKLGLPVEAYVRYKVLAAKNRGTEARAIRACQAHDALHDSADLIREDRAAL